MALSWRVNQPLIIVKYSYKNKGGLRYAITAPVMIQIGTGTTLYPLENRCCAQVTACGVRTRTKYATRVATSATGGVFKMLGNPACSPSNNLTAINGTAPTTDAPVTQAVRKGAL